MLELISFVAGILVSMLLFAIVLRVFGLPDALANHLDRRLRRPDPGPPSGDLDEAAARVLGQSLRRAQASPEAAAQVTAAFWAADSPNRRALAQLVAGMSVDGPVEDDADLLAVLRSLPAASGSSSEGDKKRPATTDIRGRFA
jgi:hypothetical protein